MKEAIFICLWLIWLDKITIRTYEISKRKRPEKIRDYIYYFISSNILVILIVLFLLEFSKNHINWINIFIGVLIQFTTVCILPNFDKPFSKFLLKRRIKKARKLVEKIENQLKKGL